MPAMDPFPDAMFFEAVITPHRSLSRAGMRRLLAAICLMCGASASVFFWLGAYPVVGFTAIELPLVAWLLRRNALAARASEIVTISPSALDIRRTTPEGRRIAVSLPVAWLQVTLREAPGRVPTLLVGTRGDRQEIGRSLGEEEKRDLARAIEGALHRWRNFFPPPPRGEGGR